MHYTSMLSLSPSSPPPPLVKGTCVQILLPCAVKLSASVSLTVFKSVILSHFKKTKKKVLSYNENCSILRKSSLRWPRLLTPEHQERQSAWPSLHITSGPKQLAVQCYFLCPAVLLQPLMLSAILQDVFC